ncbi:yeats family-domain-containing protein [Radiomyces spectabilis]|uniref:yeats family-domain-containing protein n=1 Tax=Radiomyces spectabilis TaxID=64574 RepID=UPI0022206236|nr:yeats family-domain-containing protein [Radiomyces spectabilis]KAI8393357.1 yeats family-domain-containing protein [Radiomyces spectabilis]
MKIEKHVKISSSNSIVRAKSTDAYLWRMWKVQVRLMDRDASLSGFVDHIEYILHESFENPRVVCTNEPYLLEQEGWGEFDLGIVFHFKDPSTSPQTLWFDLNFAKPKYSIYSTLVFRDPSPELMLLLRTVFQNDSQKKRRRLSTDNKRRGSSTEMEFIMDAKYAEDWLASMSRSRGIGAKNVPEDVDLSDLARCLQSLDDDELRELYHILSKYNTSDMLFVETEAEILFDLYSLGPVLLSRLWEFSKHVKRQRHERSINNHYYAHHPQNNPSHCVNSVPFYG